MFPLLKEFFFYETTMVGHPLFWRYKRMEICFTTKELMPESPDVEETSKNLPWKCAVMPTFSEISGCDVWMGRYFLV